MKKVLFVLLFLMLGVNSFSQIVRRTDVSVEISDPEVSMITLSCFDSSVAADPAAREKEIDNKHALRKATVIISSKFATDTLKASSYYGIYYSDVLFRSRIVHVSVVCEGYQTLDQDYELMGNIESFNIFLKKEE